MKVYAPVDSAALDWGIPANNIVTDLDHAQDCQVAAVPALCTESYSYCRNQIPKDLDLASYDLVMISDIEYYAMSKIQQWIQDLKIKNWILAVGGLEHGETLDAQRTVYRPWWVYNCLKFNQYQPCQADNKPYKFEMLLGARRPHRDFAMLSFQRLGLLDHSIVTYRDVFQGHTIDHCSQRILESFLPDTLQYPYVSPNLDPDWETQDTVNHQISPFIPWEIYRRTDYSILCETLGMGNTFFMSEKAAKVLYGKRVFVALSAQYYLRYLKQLGFRTFDSILDESYDLEPDWFKRYQLAMEQIVWLSQADAGKIQDLARPILEHNHHRLFSLQQETQDQMTRLIQSHW